MACVSVGCCLPTAVPIITHLHGQTDVPDFSDGYTEVRCGAVLPGRQRVGCFGWCWQPASGDVQLRDEGGC